MLSGIHVKNLALIDEIEVDFKEHLNILTGETGAGKSIIIGSINLALGAKASKDMIRQGAGDALIELFFEVSDKKIIKKLETMDIWPEDGNIIITRRITPARSISRINGEIVSAQTLKSISGLLIDIHGQHEHQSLMNKGRHLEILDDFSKEALGSLKDKLAKAYQHYMELSEAYNSALTDEDTRLRNQSFIEYELEEIEKAGFKKGEDEELSKLYKKMANARKIMEGVQSAYGLTGREASEAISRALRFIGPLEAFDEGVAGLKSQLEDIDNLLNDFNRELSEYISDLSFDEQSFYDTEARLDEINNMKAKYGSTYEEVMAYKEAKQTELEQLQNYDAYIRELRSRLDEAAEALDDLSGQVSQIRHTQGRQLAKAIEDALKDLNFLGVQFEIAFIKRTQYTKNGIDEAEFMISTNPGEPLKPLAQVASGGELSRVMLAIKSVLADADRIETLIFDEIDAGISGRTAQKVSERLSVIAKAHQVICITHLPQIAAMADAHYIIEKKNTDSHTVTDIRPVEGDAAIEEIARMLGGVSITEKVLENAQEMKSLAQQTKKY